MGKVHDNSITYQLFGATEIAVIRDKKIFERLAAYVNELVNNDFEYLLSLLYRIDVDEKKIRALLDSRQGSNAGELIARLILERLEQKIKSREQFKPPTNIPEEEKW